MAIADLITCSYLFANSATGSAKCTGGYLNSISFSDNDVAFLLGFEIRVRSNLYFAPGVGWCRTNFDVVPTAEWSRQKGASDPPCRQVRRANESD